MLLFYRDLAAMEALARIIESFYDIQVIQKRLHHVVFVQMVLLHAFVDVGDKDQCDELDEEFAFQIFTGTDRGSAHV